VPGSPVVDYPDFVVADLSATWRLHSQHAVVLAISNIADSDYFEKRGYPLAGASFMLKYRFGL
jgi:vitamin B12 transporter